MFEAVVGNHRNKEILQNSLRDNSYSHAYLFAGPGGTQKNEMAMAFAQGLLCSGQGAKPCGRCKGCQKVEKGNHPDLHIIQPEDGSASLKINQIRQMQHSMSSKPYEGDKKIFILRKAETMGEPAQNAMLKVLEEPDKGTVLLLIANSTSGILPTILSRCQILNFAPLSFQEFSRVWSKRRAFSQEELESLYNRTQGRFGESLRVVEDDKGGEEFQRISLLLDQALRGDLDKIFEVTSYASTQHLGDIEFTDYLLIYFRNKMMGMLKDGVDSENEHLTICVINDIIDAILQFQNNTKINLNTGLQVENLLLKIQEEQHDRGSRNTI